MLVSVTGVPAVVDVLAPSAPAMRVSAPSRPATTSRRPAGLGIVAGAPIWYRRRHRSRTLSGTVTRLVSSPEPPMTFSNPDVDPLRTHHRWALRGQRDDTP